MRMRFALAAALAVFGLGRSFAQEALVRFHGPLSRVITPNDDRVNDRAFFCFENPQDSEISGKIYSLLGREVASIEARRERSNAVNGAGSACPPAVIRAQFSSWDGTANGVRVRSGLYVYRIISEGQIFSGTLLVVR